MTSLTALRRHSHVIVCGGDALAYRLADELAEREEQVTVVLPSRKTTHGKRITGIPRIRVVEAPGADDDALRSARVETAKAIAFLDQNDVGNLHAALRARAAHPRILIVLRLFNTAVRRQVRELLDDRVVVLSDAAMAAPSFVAAALGEIEGHIELGGGRTLYLTRSGGVPDARAVCGVKDTAAGKRFVPAGDPGAGVLLALADERREPERSLARHRMRAAATRAWDLLRDTADRKLRVATLALFSFVVVGTFLIAENHHPHISWWQSAYVVMLTTAGGIDPDLKAAGIEQVTHMLVSFAGVALVPVLTASIVETVVGRRLAAQTNRLRKPISDHVIVVGLGNVGVQVMTQLAKLGVPVVAVEIDEDAPGAETARLLGVPVVHGDASRAETLQEAQVRTCRSLVAVTSSDVANLESAWNARGIRTSLRVIMRIGDGDLAGRIQESSTGLETISVSTVAAPSFAAALTAQEVKGAFTVGRTVLVVAEVDVAEGSEFDGGTVDTVRAAPVRTGAWTLAVTRGPTTEFTPASARRLTAGDRLLVVAGRADLRRTMRRAAPPPDTVP